MKFNKLSPVALATTLALGGLAVVPAANAGMSASAAVSNFYLWRGRDVSGGTPQVSGSLDYKDESGAFVGIWGSSVWGNASGGGTTDGIETDLYAGYVGAVGGLSYHVAFWEYLYPEDNALVGGDYSDSDLSELVLGMSYAGVGMTVFFGNDAAGGADYEYVTLDYTMGAFKILYGTWMVDSTASTPNPDESSHLTFSYAVADNFTLTFTKGMQDTTSSVYDEDILFHLSYSLPIEIK